MSPSLLAKIQIALVDVEKLLKSAVHESSASSSGVGKEALARLHRDIDKRLDLLEQDLGPLVTPPEAKRARFPLTLHVDEKVLSRLPTLADKLAWPRLQREVLQSELGGEAFYRRLDKLLAQPPSGKDPFVLEVYHLCLKEGFQGCHDREAIQKCELRIEKRLTPHREIGQPEAKKQDERSPHKPKRAYPPALYYAATAVLVVLIVALPILLSNL